MPVFSHEGKGKKGKEKGGQGGTGREKEKILFKGNLYFYLCPLPLTFSLGTTMKSPAPSFILAVECLNTLVNPSEPLLFEVK